MSGPTLEDAVGLPVYVRTIREPDETLKALAGAWGRIVEPDDGMWRVHLVGHIGPAPDLELLVLDVIESFWPEELDAACPDCFEAQGGTPPDCPCGGRGHHPDVAVVPKPPEAAPVPVELAA